jgi:hypothetical protein
MREAVTAMLVNAQLPHDEATVSRAVERLKAERCTTGLWKVGWLLMTLGIDLG